MYSEKMALEKLSSMLSEKRFRHSIGVRDTAVLLAERFGADVAKAQIAGLLHDCAKEIPFDNAVAECKRKCIEYDAMEAKNPALLHAPLGAAKAEELFGITDNEIKLAIRYHTVGHANMTKLEKIIYLADMIEPNRDYDGVDVLRELAKRSLDECLYEALRQVIEFNAHKGRLIHLGSVKAYNDIKRLLKGGL